MLCYLKKRNVYCKNTSYHPLRVVWPSGLWRYSEEHVVYKKIHNGNCCQIATEFDLQRVKKFAYYKKQKIMQDCINVKSSGNNKVRYLARKGRNKKKAKSKAMCKKYEDLQNLKMAEDIPFSVERDSHSTLA